MIEDRECCSCTMRSWYCTVWMYMRTTHTYISYMTSSGRQLENWRTAHRRRLRQRSCPLSPLMHQRKDGTVNAWCPPPGPINAHGSFVSYSDCVLWTNNAGYTQLGDEAKGKTCRRLRGQGSSRLPGLPACQDCHDPSRPVTGHVLLPRQFSELSKSQICNSGVSLRRAVPQASGPPNRLLDPIQPTVFVRHRH
jgi:hypothetical protein